MHLDRFVRWPFEALDDMTGPLAPENVWFVCGASDGGKTTFVASIIGLREAAGTKMYIRRSKHDHAKGDYLSKYLPPKDELIAFGSLKRQSATGKI